MVRLIGFILVFVVFLAFIVLNLNNKCDISFGFQKVSDVPVFITAFASFVLGMLVTAPFVILGRRKRSGPPDEGKPPKPGKGRKAAPPGPAADGGLEDLPAANTP
jgi:hypothetical protein